MNMWEAIQALKATGEILSPTPGIGIRPKSWGEHITQRCLVKTGFNGTSMFGVRFYHPERKEWWQTWSVYFPTWCEVSEEWEIVPNEVMKERQVAGHHLDEKEIQRVINLKKCDVCEEFVHWRDIKPRLHTDEMAVCKKCS